MEKEPRIFVGALISVSGILVLAYLRRKSGQKQGQRNLQEPPTCLGELPWLGHALAYRHDPRNFMLGHAGVGLFRLNMAGLRMTVVAGREEMAQVVNAPENILSSKEATADFGFAWTLGQLNVFTGTDFHRRVLKQRGFSMASARVLDDELSMKEAVAEAISAAFSKERIIITDFLKTVRRTMLHAVVVHLLGTQLLKAYHDQGSDFLDDFMHLQDCIEDATAKGVALPRPLSWFFIWLPVFRLRKRVQAKLDRALNVWPASAKKGLWLQAATSAEVGRPGNEHAELIIGLLFAAHKNPAIGAAQTLLLLLEHPKELEKAVIGDRVFSEFVMRSIKETLRLTAHTIGAIRKVVSGDFCIKSHGSMYVVPHGQYVVVSHLLPNLDPTDFPSPQSFQPDRFAEEFDDFSFTTFSQGLHRCPGRFYALHLMNLVVCELLATFHLSLQSPVVALDFSRATLAQRAGKCEVEIRPRRQILEVMQ